MQNVRHAYPCRHVLRHIFIEEKQDDFLMHCHTLLINSRHAEQPWFSLLSSSFVSLAAHSPDSLTIQNLIDTLLQAWSRFEHPPGTLYFMSCYIKQRLES